MKYICSIVVADKPSLCDVCVKKADPEVESLGPADWFEQFGNVLWFKGWGFAYILTKEEVRSWVLAA
eukprot:2907903-Amphidinium_carterae.1